MAAAANTIRLINELRATEFLYLVINLSTARTQTSYKWDCLNICLKFSEVGFICLLTCSVATLIDIYYLIEHNIKML